MRSPLGVVVVFENGKRLSARQVEERLSVNPEAHRIFRLARKHRRAEMIIGVAGGMIALAPLVQSIGREGPVENEWSVHAVGTGVMLASLPLTRSWNRKTRRAVGIYNQSSLSDYEASSPIRLGLVAGQNSLGLGMQF